MDYLEMSNLVVLIGLTLTIPIYAYMSFIVNVFWVYGPWRGLYFLLGFLSLTRV